MDDLSALGATLEQDAELSSYLADPRVLVTQKREAIKGWLESFACDLTVDFVDMVVTRGREGVVLEAARVFRELLEQDKGIVRVTVTSARTLEDDLRDNLVKKISDVTGKTVQLTESVDEKELCGMSVKIGNRLFDGTVRRRLEDMQRQLSQASI